VAVAFQVAAARSLEAAADATAPELAYAYAANAA